MGRPRKLQRRSTYRPGHRASPGMGWVGQGKDGRWRGRFTWRDPATGESRLIYLRGADEEDVLARWEERKAELAPPPQFDTAVEDPFEVRADDWDSVLNRFDDIEELFQILIRRIRVLEQRLDAPRRTPLRASFRAALHLRDGHRCRYCGRELAVGERELDHVNPVSRGGKDTEDNLVTACHPCNMRKGVKTLEQAGMVLLPVPVPESV